MFASSRNRLAPFATLAVALTGLVLANAGVAAQAASVTVLDPSGASVSAYGGWAAWTHTGAHPGEYSLMVRSPAGAVSPAQVPVSNGPFDVELGPGTHGVEAVYQRCSDPTDERGCNIYELTLTTPDATERELAIRGGGSKFMPAIWKGSLAFLRANPGGGKRRPENLYVESIPSGSLHAVTLPVSRGAREPQGGRWPSGLTGTITGLTVSSSQLAYVTSNTVGSFGETTLWYEPIGGRPELIDQETGGAGNVCPPSFLSPVISGGWLYAYLHACDPSANPGFDRLTRYRRGEAQRARYTFARFGDDALSSVVPDGSGVDWDDEGLRRLSGVSWRRIPPPVAETFCARSNPFC